MDIDGPLSSDSDTKINALLAHVISPKQKKGDNDSILKYRMDTDSSISTSSTLKRGRHGFETLLPNAAPNDTGVKGEFNLDVGALNTGAGDLLAAETDSVIMEERWRKRSGKLLMSAKILTKL